MRAGPVLVGLAAALVAAAGPLAADEPLPPGTVVSTGAPPLVPGGGRDRLSGWVDACLASGRRQAGTRLGGDLLFSAGMALARRLDDPHRALAVLGEAAAAYPTDAPYRGLVLLAAADLRLAGGDAVAARRLLDAAQAAASRPPPVDADVVTLSRHDLLAGRMASVGAGLGVRIDEAAGDLARAAARQARLAETLDRRGEPGADQAWARAARLHARTGDLAGALAAVDRALELTASDETRARLSFWRLHARHGLLDAEGAPTLGAHWPGDAFVEDVHATLRGLQGNPAVGTWLLALASRAVTAGRDDAALGLYQLALGDPVLVDRARSEPLVRGGLLVAFPVALRLGRFEEAERILDVVAGIADGPGQDMDAYRVALARAREKAAREEVPTPEPAVEEESADDSEPPPSPHRGRLHPHGPPPAADVGSEPRPDTVDEADEGGASSVPAGRVAALCGLAGVALFATLAMRRRRRRASLGGPPSRR